MDKLQYLFFLSIFLPLLGVIGGCLFWGLFERQFRLGIIFFILSNLIFSSSFSYTIIFICLFFKGNIDIFLNLSFSFHFLSVFWELQGDIVTFFKNFLITSISLLVHADAFDKQYLNLTGYLFLSLLTFIMLVLVSTSSFIFYIN
jgi:hypothetical protein